MVRPVDEVLGSIFTVRGAEPQFVTRILIVAVAPAQAWLANVPNGCGSQHGGGMWQPHVRPRLRATAGRAAPRTAEVPPINEESTLKPVRDPTVMRSATTSAREPSFRSFA